MVNPKMGSLLEFVTSRISPKRGSSFEAIPENDTIPTFALEDNNNDQSPIIAHNTHQNTTSDVVNNNKNTTNNENNITTREITHATTASPQINTILGSHGPSLAALGSNPELVESHSASAIFVTSSGGVSSGSTSNASTSTVVSETSSMDGDQAGFVKSPIVKVDIDLLAKLEEANRKLETDGKALSNLTPPKVSKARKGQGHSRHASISSVASNLSQCSSVSQIDFEPANAEELWALWSKLVSDWDNVYKKRTSYVKDLVAKGVPPPFRGIVWQMLCGAHTSEEKGRYSEYLKMTSPMEKLIRRDITRTYPEHDFFKEKNGLGQESLFNVMKAYSLHDREVGYCQGSGFIVGLLLMQMPEEEAFAVLVKLMEDYRMRELFKPSMAELGVCMFQLESLIQDILPTLYTHFSTQQLSVTMFASSWFLTVFTTSLPLTLACRVFDLFLMEGTEFIFRVGIGLLNLCQDQLLELDMEGVLKFLQKDALTTALESRHDQLIQTALNLKFNSKRLKRLEKEYNTLKTKETEEQVEIRRLRTENKLLRQRVDNLEKETSTLADRLIQDQVRCAQQDEHMSALKKQLSVSRTRTQELTNQLQQAEENGNSSEQQNGSDEDGLRAQISELKAKDAQSTALIKQLQTKLNTLENNHSSQETKSPSEELQTMQEELIACKLREAEANLALKELQHTVTDLKQQWQKNVDRLAACNPLSKASKQEVRVITDEIMSVRIREAQAVAELKDIKQRVMEQETQSHITTRQVKRLEEENQRLRDELEEASTKHKEFEDQLQDQQRKADSYESNKKESEMMQRLRDAEHSQTVAEMRQRIAELEIKTQEFETAGQLHDETGDLQNRIAELQDQIVQLKLSRRPGSLSQMSLSLESGDSDLDDDLEVTIRDERLTLTESCCGFLPGDNDLDLNSRSNKKPSYLDSFLDNDVKNSTYHTRSYELDGNESDNTIEGAFNDSTLTRNKKKKRDKTDKSVDLDKTPTQDNMDCELFVYKSDKSGDDEKIDSDLNSNSNNNISTTNSLHCDEEKTCNIVDVNSSVLETEHSALLTDSSNTESLGTRTEP